AKAGALSWIPAVNPDADSFRCHPGILATLPTTPTARAHTCAQELSTVAAKRVPSLCEIQTHWWVKLVGKNW
ncbi:MAG: hypothetical protein ACRETN_00575, partial [Nevskiales bacterium]